MYLTFEIVFNLYTSIFMCKPYSNNQSLDQPPSPFKQVEQFFFYRIPAICVIIRNLMSELESTRKDRCCIMYIEVTDIQMSNIKTYHMSWHCGVKKGGKGQTHIHIATSAGYYFVCIVTGSAQFKMIKHSYNILKPIEYAAKGTHA